MKENNKGCAYYNRYILSEKQDYTGGFYGKSSFTGRS